MERTHFLKSDARQLNTFYRDGGPWDRLSKQGKDALTWRVHLGTKTSAERALLIANKKRLCAGGTIIVDVFNEYQQLLIADMKKSGERKIGFKTLQAMLVKNLRLGDDIKDWEKLDWKERDAIWYSHQVRELFHSRFRLFEGKVSQEGEEIWKNQMRLMAENLLVFAHLEFMAGLFEKMADDELAKNR